jgi:hypothetical protein
MIQVLLGTVAGLAIGLAIEWLVDWSGWTTKRASVRAKSQLRQGLRRSPDGTSSTPSSPHTGVVSPDVEPTRTDEDDKAAHS